HLDRLALGADDDAAVALIERRAVTLLAGLEPSQEGMKESQVAAGGGERTVFLAAGDLDDLGRNDGRAGDHLGVGGHEAVPISEGRQCRTPISLPASRKPNIRKPKAAKRLRKASLSSRIFRSRI